MKSGCCTKDARQSVVVAIMKKKGELAPGDKVPPIQDGESCSRYHSRCRGVLCRLRNWFGRLASR